jgi:hypothetical protein
MFRHSVGCRLQNLIKYLHFRNTFFVSNTGCMYVCMYVCTYVQFAPELLRLKHGKPIMRYMQTVALAGMS